MSVALPTSSLWRNLSPSALTPSREISCASSSDAAMPATATDREVPIRVRPVSSSLRSMGKTRRSPSCLFSRAKARSRSTASPGAWEAEVP